MTTFPISRFRFPIHTFAALLVLASLTTHLTGCASLHPPLSEPAHAPDAASIEPIRVDTQGLKFRLYASETTAGDSVEVWRRSNSSEWTNIQTIAVDDALADALATGHARWTDPLDDASGTLEYRLRIISDDQATLSEPIPAGDARWLQPPTPRIEPDDTRPRVVVEWEDSHRLEARLLRRDVLSDDDFTPVAIVDGAAGNKFVDTTVEPGGVYSYRIQFVDRIDDVPRFSPFVETDYVVIPDADR